MQKSDLPDYITRNSLHKFCRIVSRPVEGNPQDAIYVLGMVGGPSPRISFEKIISWLGLYVMYQRPICVMISFIICTRQLLLK
jgi:hypothetical protein